MTLRYVPTRIRDRYRVFDGERFLGVVEQPRYSYVLLRSRRELMPMWCVVVCSDGLRRWHPKCYLSRAEAGEALREMKEGA